MAEDRVIKIKESIVTREDPASREKLGRVNPRASRFMMFTQNSDASWICDQLLKEAAYPPKVIAFEANRKTFRYQPGDLIKYKINDSLDYVVWRIASVKEANIETEKLMISAYRDIDYIGVDIDDEGQDGLSEVDIIETIDPLQHVSVVESPYILSGDELRIVPLAARRSGQEVGWFLYMSLDGGDHYDIIGHAYKWSVYGITTTEFPITTHAIDDDIGFRVDFSDMVSTELEKMQSITRAASLTQQNLCLLGNELISFSTVTPITSTLYEFTGVVRGRWDTEEQTHAIGTDFWYLGASHWKSFVNNEIGVGKSLKFKIVPFTLRVISEDLLALTNSLTIVGRCRKPYIPNNLKCNSKAQRPRYSSDCVLTWGSRLRGKGLGTYSLQNPIPTFSPQWEGYYKIQVEVSGSVVRTVTGVNAKTWTYTSAMNISDNGSLANEITFKVSNYREEDGFTYESDQREIIIYKE